MDIILTIPDNKAQRIVNGICGTFGYQDTIDDLDDNSMPRSVPNPETKTQFSKRMLYKMIKDAVMAWESARDAEAARLAAISDVENNIILE